VSAARRSQPATTAVSAMVASMTLVSLETECMVYLLEYSFRLAVAHPRLGGVTDRVSVTRAVEQYGWNAGFRIALLGIQRSFRANLAIPASTRRRSVFFLIEIKPCGNGVKVTCRMGKPYTHS
jgi:hypothetical protein